MGYIVEYRDESHFEEVLEKVHKAKKAICEALKALEENEGYSERDAAYYRDGSMGYRGEDGGESGAMRMRRGGRFRY